jgi:hypothetical protein
MRKFLRVVAKLAPAAAALALCSSAQAATYAWGITKSIDAADASFRWPRAGHTLSTTTCSS